jgi:hypothetical protein
MTYALRKHFESLMLPTEAAEWLLMVWQAIQTFDDVADDDEVLRADLDATIWNVLVAMPQNPFFARHAGTLLPLLGTMVLKWQASDRVERDGQADARSFTWRAGYYELILVAVQLIHGASAAVSVAHKVLGMYGESLDSYLAEFGPNGGGDA